jgi:hypothetical protein
MNNKDNFTGNLSFFGRLADEITREVIPCKSFTVSIQNHRAVPLYKEDGFFVFSDLEHSGQLPFSFNRPIIPTPGSRKKFTAGFTGRIEF